MSQFLGYIFRTVAGNGAGYGHFFRCLYIAKALVDRRLPVGFALKQPDVLAQKVLRKANIPSTILSVTEHEFKSMQNRFPKYYYLVIDDFVLNKEYELQARNFFKKIIVIDGMLREHACDLWIDPSSRKNQEHTKLNQWDGKVLCGLDYTLTSPEYRLLREKNSRKLNKVSNTLRTLINFGGKADIDVSPLLDSLERACFKGEAIIIGKPSDRENASTTKPFKITKSLWTDSMAHLLANVDFAIGAGGISAWERCVIGVPSLLFAIAENQHHVCHTIENANAGSAFYATPDKIDPAAIDTVLSRFINDSAWRSRVSKNCMDMIDGLGVERVAEVLAN